MVQTPVNGNISEKNSVVETLADIKIMSRKNYR
jgi:hypothetical protein